MATISSEISSPIKPEMLSIAAPLARFPSRLELQPAHGPGYSYQAPGPALSTPGIDYIPVPSKANVNTGMAPLDVNNRIAEGAPLPFGAGRSASGAVIPDIGGTSTIIPGTPVYTPQPITTGAAVPPKETAVPAGKPVGSTGPVLTEKPAVTAATSSINMQIVGPGSIEPNRFVQIPGGGMQINPYAPGIVNEARRAGAGIEQTGPVAGGNVSQFVQSSAQQSEVAARREEGSAALDQLNATLNKANLMEGAHGPREAARAMKSIAQIEALGERTKQKRTNEDLLVAKTKVEMAKNISDIQKNQAEIARKGSFDEEKDYERNIQVLKDPGMAQWLTTARKSIHAGTHEWADTQLDMYDTEGKSTLPVKIQGAIPKQYQKAYQGTLMEYEQAKKLLEENSGLFDSTSTYRKKLLAIQEKFKRSLEGYGLKILPVDTTKL